VQWPGAGCNVRALRTGILFVLTLSYPVPHLFAAGVAVAGQDQHIDLVEIKNDMLVFSPRRADSFE
jgi:predicted peptidase